MSQNIWTRCEGSYRLAPLSLAAWRVVESQFVTSTRKLVDSDVEQEWVCTAARQQVELSKKDLFRKQRFTFQRGDFEVDGTLPAPAV